MKGGMSNGSEWGEQVEMKGKQCGEKKGGCWGCVLWIVRMGVLMLWKNIMVAPLLYRHYFSI